MKKIFLPMILGLLAFHAAGAVAAEAVNAACLVMPDHKINGKTFVEYQGKTYGFCCKSCVKKFNKNPEKYIARLASAQG